MVERIAVGGIEVEYDEVGSGGRPFVMVHGFTGSRDDFADVLDPFAALGRTLVPDLRGHGGTTNAGEGYTLDQLTDDLSGFLDATGVERCDLLGHSLGGMVALRLTLAEPERVASLVLMDTSPHFDSQVSMRTLRIMSSIARWLPRPWLWRFMRANRKRLPEATRRAEREMGVERFWQRMQAKIEAMDPIAFKELLRSVAVQTPLDDRLHEIHCPTLVVVGEADQNFRRPSDVLANGIADAKLVVFENAHHSPQVEVREAWLAVILAHLERARV